MDNPAELPRIGAPATRALAGVGIHTLEDLRGRDVDALGALHGVGPRALRLLKAALKERGDD